MTLRIGIIGAGRNTRSKHLPGFQKIDGVEVTAVCNRTRESGQMVAEEFGIPAVCDDWKELVERDDVDALCVGTWPNMHCETTLAALKAGKHVLTEARMAMNLAEARQMLAAAQRSDCVAMVVPAPIFLESESTLLEMIVDGFFGDWLEINSSFLSGGYDEGAPIHWRQRRDLSGNNIMAMGIVNETVRRYAGDERAVIAHGKIFTPERADADTGARLKVDVPESLGVISELESGATAVYHCSSVARPKRGPEIAAYGTRASFQLAAGQASVAGPGEDTFKPLGVAQEKRGGWRVEEDFVDAIRDGKEVTHTSFADGVKYMEFTEAVNISLAEGRRVELPLP